MLRPHDREDAELDEVRLAAEGVEDAVIFVGREAVLGDHLGGDAGSFEDVHAARSSHLAVTPIGVLALALSNVVTGELVAREDEGLRAPVDEVGEGRTLGRPAFVADAPELSPILVIGTLCPEPQPAAALDDLRHAEPWAVVDIAAGELCQLGIARGRLLPAPART